MWKCFSSRESRVCIQSMDTLYWKGSDKISMIGLPKKIEFTEMDNISKDCYHTNTMRQHSVPVAIEQSPWNIQRVALDSKCLYSACADNRAKETTTKTMFIA